MKKTDFLIIAVLLIAAFAIYGLRYFNDKTTEVAAEIYYKGEYCCTLDLDKNMVYIHPDLPNVKIQIKDGKVGFVESDCPDKVCINTGFLSVEGQTAVCLPNKISVVIKSKANDVDTVV